MIDAKVNLIFSKDFLDELFQMLAPTSKVCMSMIQVDRLQSRHLLDEIKLVFETHKRDLLDDTPLSEAERTQPCSGSIRSAK